MTPFLGNLRNCSLRGKSPNSFILVMGIGFLNLVYKKSHFEKMAF